MSPTPAMIEPTPPPPVPSPDTIIPAQNVPPPSANGDDPTALARLADADAPPPPPAPLEAPPPPPLSLEERVRRLEEALALLQEQRAATPSAARPPERPPESAPAPAPPVSAPPTSTAVLLDVGKRLLGAASPAIPPAPLAVPSIAQPPERVGLLWLFRDTWAEARAIVRMFVDPRYRMPWSARVLPLVLLAAILIPKKYWFPGAQIPVLGDWLLSELINLLLAFLLFKWLGHEARRYRQTSPDLPSSLRL